MTTSGESKVERLRKQAERAIAAEKSRKVIVPLLERLLAAAPPGSEPSVYAHRQLLDHLVEHHPWRALLHAREVLAHGGHAVRQDDGLHAFVGLAHALLGNYAAAVAAYRRAVAIVPTNPWYQHNLGHLLDVALERPAAARRHLEAAHRGAGPDDGEISASLAHCLAQLGELDAARALAEVACETAPSNPEHARLLAWIRGGAVPGALAEAEPPDAVEEAIDAEHAVHDVPRRRDAVTVLLEARIAEDEILLGRALSLWSDYAATKEAGFLDATPAPVWAAMVDFACRDRSTSRTSSGRTSSGPASSGRTSPGEPIAGRARGVGSLAATARRYRVKTEALRARWIALLEEWASAGGRWASLSREVEAPAQQRAHD